MLRDWCTWDRDYNQIVQDIRRTLVHLATDSPGYTAVLMQGSGTFAVEAAVTTAVPREGRLLVLANGAYGRRIAEIARRAGIGHRVYDSGEVDPPDLDRLGAGSSKGTRPSPTWRRCTAKPPRACSIQRQTSAPWSKPPAGHSSWTP